MPRELTDDPDGPRITATFAIDRKRLDELETTGAIVTKYHALEQSRGELYQGYVYAFGALLGATMLLTLVLGILLAQEVTKRINLLATGIAVVAGATCPCAYP